MNKNLINKIIKIIWVICFGVVCFFSFNQIQEIKPIGKYKITYLNMYQSNATIITFPNHQTIVIDSGTNCGSRYPVYSNRDDKNHKSHKIDSKYTLLYPKLQEALMEHGVDKGEKIAYYIETHPDPDHDGASGELIRDYDVEHYYCPKVDMDLLLSKNQKMQALEEASKKHLVPYYPSRNLKINMGKNSSIEFLNKKQNNVMKNYKMKYYSMYNNLTELKTTSQVKDAIVNGSSLAFMITIDNQKFLFCGDMNKIELNELAKTYKDKLKCDILLAPHHGSNKSDSPLFYYYARPNITIVSCAKDCKEGGCYNHPQKYHLKTMLKYSNEVKYTYNYKYGIVYEDSIY